MKRARKALRTTTVRYPEDLKAALKKQAKLEHRSANNLAVVLLWEGLELRKKQQGESHGNGN
jgi:hypothetical protein